MNWYSIFYWLTVSNSVKKTLDVFSNWFLFFAIVSFVVFVIIRITYFANDVAMQPEDSEDKKTYLRRSKAIAVVFRWSMICTFITWTAWSFVPSRNDCLLIIAGGSVGNFLTSDSSAKAIPSDIADFLHTSLRKEVLDLQGEVKRDIGVKDSTQLRAESYADKLRKMSKEELITYLKKDTTLLR